MATWANVAAPAGKGFFEGIKIPQWLHWSSKFSSWKVLFSKGHGKRKNPTHGGKKIKIHSSQPNCRDIMFKEYFNESFIFSKILKRALFNLLVFHEVIKNTVDKLNNTWIFCDIDSSA